MPINTVKKSQTPHNSLARRSGNQAVVTVIARLGEPAGALHDLGDVLRQQGVGLACKASARDELTQKQRRFERQGRTRRVVVVAPEVAGAAPGGDAREAVALVVVQDGLELAVRVPDPRLHLQVRTTVSQLRSGALNGT